MYIARFKTAYHQREVVVSAKLTVDTPAVGSNAGNYKDIEGKSIKGLPIGTMLSYNKATNTFTEVKATVSGGSVTAAPAVTLGNYIIAQSDATMSGGHVPVETLSYKYIGAYDFVGESATEKNIALFEITDVNDVVVSEK